VLNLVPDKEKVIKEIFRVLKPGGHFSISDVVLVGSLPTALQEDAEMYAGCVSGAIQKDAYLNYIKETGFESIALQKEKPIIIPVDILSKYLTPQEVQEFQSGKTGIFSITVFGQKPGGTQKKKLKTKMSDLKDNSCAPGSGCC
ncbi:MAG TPA: methyltransferase domain-containing protein, partial [Salinimicrobium catena]|nr:methyltransferase domain-containing protein [Salinimicrobium catena]